MLALPRFVRLAARALLLTAALAAPATYCRASGPDGQVQSREEPLSEGTSEYFGLANAPAFLPRSYLYWGTPVGGATAPEQLVFALEYALHLPAYNNLRSQALRGNSWAGAVTLTFEGALRMLAQDSKPVRMPSYRPTLSTQVFYLWHRPVPLLFGLRLALFHHSNGQERCIFDPALPDKSDACRRTIAQVEAPAASLNRINGSFTNNGWLLEIDFRAHQTDARGVTVGQLALGVHLASALRAGPGRMYPELRHLYGWGSIRPFIEAQRRLGRARLGAQAGLTHFLGSHGSVPSTSGECEAIASPYWLAGFGFFARYYGGRDFYNAFFVDAIHQFAAGLSWDGELPLRFFPPP